jgi:hypothetical protein
MTTPERRNDLNRKSQAQKNAAHRAGVARRLARIEALVEDLPAAIVAALAERQQQQERQNGAE